MWPREAGRRSWRQEGARSDRQPRGEGSPGAERQKRPITLISQRVLNVPRCQHVTHRAAWRGAVASGGPARRTGRESVITQRDRTEGPELHFNPERPSSGCTRPRPPAQSTARPSGGQGETGARHTDFAWFSPGDDSRERNRQTRRKTRERHPQSLRASEEEPVRALIRHTILTCHRAAGIVRRAQ